MSIASQPQLIQVEARPEEVMRKTTLGGAIDLCLELGDLSGPDKCAREGLKDRGMAVDKAQLSRWKDGSEGVVWPKLLQLMDVCGNHAPILWMAHQAGYDIYSMHQRETELQRENRLLREQNAALIAALRTQK